VSVDDELEARSQRGTIRGADAVWASEPVRAALKRKKIPLWVMPVLIFIPVWALIYVGGLSHTASGAPTQIQEGATIFATSCAQCHGSTGGGGVGRPLSNGDVVKTFPDLIAQLEFVHQGSATTGPKGTPYGDPNRDGGQHTTQSFNGGLMPSFAETLTGEQLLAVVRYEREVLSGASIDARKLAADGKMLWSNGKPTTDATGKLITPDGQPLFDAAGNLTLQPNWANPVVGSG
jgi:mono/diheme cytochrome c family protein